MEANAQTALKTPTDWVLGTVGIGVGAALTWVVSTYVGLFLWAQKATGIIGTVVPVVIAVTSATLIPLSHMVALGMPNLGGNAVATMGTAAAVMAAVNAGVSSGGRNAILVSATASAAISLWSSSRGRWPL